MIHGLRLAGIALVSAVLTASLVIGVGEAIRERGTAGPSVIQASLS
ncbi:hypothetical protein JIP62_11895 [Brevundimonas vitis]|uniref:ABC transporter permease n=1 Tax=Brevundimonas vitisensis TaxID=2800818 RepID=A0ABX7BKR8_9CAUL|nr:hypothetical protein [Brevundimonas vitisensis]QQQ18010.1 hypothetical protein JIP62_11895 [Brevundimonas vitisensis]